MEKVAGVILAGGLARRLGGVDKGLVEIGGAPILARLVARLRPQCAGLAVNANGDPARFARFGLPVVADTIPDFAGPLAGVLAGMEFFAQRREACDFLISVPGDTPFVPRDLVARLVAAHRRESAQIAVARSGERTHHAVALWPLVLCGALREALLAGQGKVSGFIARYPNVVVDWPVEPYDPFLNVNAPEDVPRAEAAAPKADAPPTRNSPTESGESP
jgi:molybdopterin-guanine dinucleotide biosynthesis protein A